MVQQQTELLLQTAAHLLMQHPQIPVLTLLLPQQVHLPVMHHLMLVLH